MLNIYYHENDKINADSPYKQHHYLSLTDVTQCIEYGEHEFNVTSNKESINADWPVIVPIDQQSSPLSYESRTGIDAVSDFGKMTEKFIDEMATHLASYKVVFVLYTSTEPYFFDDVHFLYDLVRRYPQCFFIKSGSGHRPVRYHEVKKKLYALPNFKFISKSWYFDRVHYNKFLRENGDCHHFTENQKTPPENTPDYITCPNTFLLTMRNPRAHRLIMSSFIENNVDDYQLLNSTRYSRAWSMQSWALEEIHNNPESRHEFVYQVSLITSALKDVIDESIGAGNLEQVLHALYQPPHRLDMKHIGDKGFPPRWLYNNINIVVVASGEPDGYGYIDEKQIIPIFYKKPFLSFGSRGVNEELEKIGFNTYSSVFDTASYINKETLYDRVKGCYDLMRNIVHMPPEDLAHKLDTECTLIAEKNYQTFVSCKFRILSNNYFFREVLDACN
jgi:hypothetical protein